MTSRPLAYYNNCVSWPRHDVEADGGLSDCISVSRPISRKRFCALVNRSDREQLEKLLGYVKDRRRGMTAVQDHAIGYYTSRLHGQRVAYLKHSAIEYVFAP